MRSGMKDIIDLTKSKQSEHEASIMERELRARIDSKVTEAEDK